MNAFDAWCADRSILHIARRSARCTVLGPGARAVLWVQGCPFRCRGCVAPETLPFVGGTPEQVDGLAAELSVLPDIEGISISGGEPFAQAPALCALIDSTHERRPDLTFMSYTGYRIEQLQGRGTNAQKSLLNKLDILVDGPYLRERHTDLRWRGSSNQRILILSSRYRKLAETVHEPGTWIEFEFGADGSLHWMGIPPEGFRETFEYEMAQRGIKLQTMEV